MCVICEPEVLPVYQQPYFDSKRKKIWELESSFHCSVVGTCLKLAELHQLCKKMRISMQAKVNDYDWHHSFVTIASSESFAAKTLNKHLDKKYKTTIRQALKLNGEELENFWRESLRDDNLPAAFWTLLTHPGVQNSLLDKIYGEVHMLSHLSGASLRVDMEKLKQLEKEKIKRNLSVNDENEKSRKKITEQSVLISSLKQKLEKDNAMELELDEANSLIKKLKSNKLLKNLKEMLSEVESKLEIKITRVHHLEQSVDEWKQSALKCGDQIGLVEAQLQALRKENQAMENTLESYLTQNCSSCDNQENYATDGSLAGSCVLYVGGRDKQCVHFRALVEEKNGTFIHHDGGLNDGSQHLGSLLPKADMIFCPIDCISHSAVNRVKQFCSRTGKPLVIMRRASLAAFTRGLNEVIA